MTQSQTQKAIELEKAEGALGAENISLIEEFAKSMMRIYYQTTGGASDYAKLKPLRELLKGYRLYRNVGRADQCVLMAGDIKRILENPPKDMAVDFWIDRSEQAQIVVNQFFKLTDQLFGGLPNLVNRHANSLAHAYDLALELHWREIYVERGQEFVRRREAKLKEFGSKRDELAGKTDLSAEETAQLEELDAEIVRIEQEISQKTSSIERIKQS